MRDRWIKRGLDVALAGSALIVTAPVLAMLSAAIRLDSPGPVLFRQIRIGRDRRPIRTLKLRTMVSDADRRGPQITADRDPRITRVGRWLRRTKLDEVPQLWNVVCGDMSLVGPRPEVPRYVDTYRPEWHEVFRVRPGITDLSSLTFRDEESLLASARDRERAYVEVLLPMKLELAIECARSSSLRHDLGILMRTVWILFRGPGPRETAIIAEARRRIERLNEGA